MANAQAFEAGWNLAAKLGAERRERKQALSDAEFKMHAERLAGELVANRKILATIDREREPDKYKSKVADLEKNLSDLRELYHPDRHPGAIAKFGHLITDALKITDPQKRIHKVAAQRAAAVAGDKQEAQEMAAATPQRPNELLEYKTALINSGFSEQQAQKALEIKAGIEARATEPKPVHESDFEKGLARFVKEKGGDPEDISIEDELAYRRAIHPPSAQKPLHESDFQIGFARYLRSKKIAPEAATAQDEAAHRRLIHPTRSLKELTDEAAKRKPAKRRHAKSAPYPH